MDFHDKESKDKGSIFSETPEPIFENVVAQKYPKEYGEMQAEEVPAEITSAQEVDRPAADVLQYIPSSAHEHKYRLFFIIAVVGFFLVMAIILIGIVGRRRGGPVVPAQPVTLTYWGLWEDEVVLKPLFEKYQKANPHVTIKYEKRDPKGYITYLNGRISNNVGPDIFRFHNTWTPYLASLNLLAAIPTEIMTSATYEQTFHKIHCQDFKINDRFYAIPLYVDGLVMLYNPEILRSAGVAKPPSAFVSDLPTVLSQVTTKDASGLRTAGIAMGNATNVTHYSDIFGMIFLLNVLDKQENLSNVWAMSALSKISTDPTSISLGGDALQIYRGFQENGFWDDNMPSSIDAFAQERVAMVFAPTWEIPIVMAKNRDLKFGVAPVPQGLDGTRVSVANYWAEGVSPKSKNQVEAWKFLVFMSQQENQEALFKSQNEYRGMGMTYARKDMVSKLTDHPYLASLVTELDYLVSIPTVSLTYDGAANDGMATYIQKAVGESAKGGGYTEAFRGISSGISTLLKQYKYIN